MQMLGFKLCEVPGELGNEFEMKLRVESSGFAEFVMYIHPDNHRKESISVTLDAEEFQGLSTVFLDAANFLISQDGHRDVEKSSIVGAIDNSDARMVFSVFVTERVKALLIMGEFADSRKKELSVGLDLLGIAEVCAGLEKGIERLFPETSKATMPAKPIYQKALAERNTLQQMRINCLEYHGEYLSHFMDSYEMPSTESMYIEDAGVNPPTRRKRKDFLFSGRVWIFLSSLFPIFVTYTLREPTLLGIFWVGWFVCLLWIAGNPGSWLHQNKDGSPDLRYKHNEFIPSFSKGFVQGAGVSLALTSLFGLAIIGANQFTQEDQTVKKHTVIRHKRKRRVRIRKRVRSGVKIALKKRCPLWGRDENNKPIKVRKSGVGEKFTFVKQFKRSTKLTKDGEVYWVTNNCLR